MGGGKGKKKTLMQNEQPIFYTMIKYEIRNRQASNKIKLKSMVTDAKQFNRLPMPSKEQMLDAKQRSIRRNPTLKKSTLEIQGIFNDDSIYFQRSQ